jgi:hypothetical protein
LRRKDCKKKEETGDSLSTDSYKMGKEQNNAGIKVSVPISAQTYNFRHTIAAHLHKKGSKNYPQLAKILALPPRTYSC